MKLPYAVDNSTLNNRTSQFLMPPNITNQKIRRRNIERSSKRKNSERSDKSKEEKKEKFGIRFIKEFSICREVCGSRS